jgi:hypothetical protein
LVSLELLSRDHPAVVNSSRALLHELATHDSNQAVRRLAIVCLKNGSPQPNTVQLLNGLADEDDQERELREIARRVAAALKERADTS